MAQTTGPHRSLTHRLTPRSLLGQPDHDHDHDGDDDDDDDEDEDEHEDGLWDNQLNTI